MSTRTKYDLPSEAEREANREPMLARLRAEIAEYEERFGICSDDVHQAIDDGRLHEDLDVVKWIMAIESLALSEGRR